MLGEAELARLSDDALIEYLRRARGDDSARLALGILVFGHWDNVRRRVAMKVPAEAVDDVTSDVLTSAIQAAFDGTSVGEFVVWLGTITKRRIADFHRRRVVTTVPLDEAEPDQIAGFHDTIALMDVIESVLARMNEDHRRVVELVVFAGVPPAEVDGVSVANVHQITSRFRRTLREELEPG